jgi:uncharacterized membrane protein HdeD (DUF308 family)
VTDKIVGLLLLLTIGGWVLASAVVAYVAIEKGRSGIGWLLVALVLSPLFAVLCLAALPSVDGEEDWPNRSRDSEPF